MVADEFAAGEIKAGTTIADLNKGDLKGHCTVYTIEVKQANPATGATLSSLSATLKGEGVTYPVTAAITGTTGVKVTVPSTMTDGVFYFDYTASTYATVAAVTDGGDVALPTTYTASETAKGAVKFEGKVLKVNTDGSSDWKEIKAIRVTSEDGNTSNYYALTVEKAEAETGAVITSLKANNQNATISGKTITVTLPFGSDLSKVAVSWTASKMATVTTTVAAKTEEDVNYYDLTDGMTITVVSEDQATTNVYTLKATVAEQFSDVQPGAWYYDNVMAAVEAGIVSGKGDGTFAPMGNITRRDFAIMVTKLLLGGKEPAEATTTPFSDVASNDYALDYIAYCAENGIISGSDGQFRPGDYITRQEAASVMKNALELTGTTSELFADDAKIAGWAKANVYACKAAGIFNGDEKNNFNPTNTLTRAEAASIMVNALNK